MTKLLLSHLPPLTLSVDSPSTSSSPVITPLSAVADVVFSQRMLDNEGGVSIAYWLWYNIH